MQQIFIELWSYKQAWHDLGEAGRADYVAKLGPAIADVLALGIEVIAWGHNRQDVDMRVDYDFFAVYRVPDEAAFAALQSAVSASGWYDYFLHANAGGIASTSESVLGDHISLATQKP
ncbi:hypothetical protein B2G71_22065 [Novosphingobium sp. PC22D]|uniref:DUF6616 family protein n=1 Tax=Novosphingobium sp. PC22D TaxID=1962403 RepID=UPI000BF0D5DD|nr:DUF6616 family protein [Novosphingobium sp. PC22D]PEQ10513.1 hypothetical protein B2G71_22065 [Novosphingobium sp. PC22D]